MATQTNRRAQLSAHRRARIARQIAAVHAVTLPPQLRHSPAFARGFGDVTEEGVRADLARAGLL
jgi:hypothetical protein